MPPTGTLRHARGLFNHPASSCLRDWKADGPFSVIDFTRYHLPAHEPNDMTRRWSLMGQINQKQTRPQDKPVPLAALPAEDQKLIREKCLKVMPITH